MYTNNIGNTKIPIVITTSAAANNIYNKSGKPKMVINMIQSKASLFLLKILV